MIILLIDVCVRRVMNVISSGSLFIGMRMESQFQPKDFLISSLGIVKSRLETIISSFEIIIPKLEIRISCAYESLFLRTHWVFLCLL